MPYVNPFLNQSTHTRVSELEQKFGNFFKKYEINIETLLKRLLSSLETPATRLTIFSELKKEAKNQQSFNLQINQVTSTAGQPSEMFPNQESQVQSQWQLSFIIGDEVVTHLRVNGAELAELKKEGILAKEDLELRKQIDTWFKNSNLVLNFASGSIFSPEVEVNYINLKK